MGERIETAQQPKIADGADSTTVCAHCGRPIDTTEWHPMRSRRDGDEFRMYAFCDGDCRDEWDDSRPTL